MVNYVDQDTGQTIQIDALTGKGNTTSDYRTTSTIADLKNKGYELVSDNYPANGVVFDTDDSVDQTYTVTLKHGNKTVTPTNPGTPGQPVDPTNPDGPKYPDGTDKSALTQTVNQTVNYVDGAGKTLAPSVTDQVIFNRNATIDLVTGKVTYTNWTSDNNTFTAKKSPVIDGYYTSQGTVAAQTVTADTDDQTVNVVYAPLGSLVPDVPGATPVPYPNDPTDPSKPGEPIIPNIPGYTPTDPNGKPLKPGDPYPVDPANPGTDTPIHYVPVAATTEPVAPSTPSKPVAPGNLVARNKSAQPVIPDQKEQASKPLPTKSQAVDNKLPQTGEADQEGLTVGGLLMILISGLLSVLGMKKKQRKE